MRRKEVRVDLENGTPINPRMTTDGDFICPSITRIKDSWIHADMDHYT